MEKIRYTKTCRQCGREFETLDGRRVFCSTGCKDRHEYKTPRRRGLLTLLEKIVIACQRHGITYGQFQQMESCGRAKYSGGYIYFLKPEWRAKK